MKQAKPDRPSANPARFGRGNPVLVQSHNPRSRSIENHACFGTRLSPSCRLAPAPWPVCKWRDQRPRPVAPGAAIPAWLSRGMPWECGTWRTTCCLAGSGVPSAWRRASSGFGNRAACATVEGSEDSAQGIGRVAVEGILELRAAADGEDVGSEAEFEGPRFSTTGSLREFVAESLYRAARVVGGELRGYPKSFVGVFWGLMRRLGNGTRVGCQATVSEASGGCC